MSLSPEATENVKKILDEATASPDTGIPGLVFIAVDKSGNELVSHASGTRGINSTQPMDLDTTFWIASMTKIVTTIACLQLYEQGKMPLDDEAFVKKWAPEIGEKKVFADGVNGVEQERGVTVRMLLAHTAGFAYTFFDPRINMVTRPQGVDEFTGDVEEILKSPMVNQPGSMWEYGVNVDWAGIILERVTGTKLNDYFQKHIFEPLGIKDTTMFPTNKMRENLAYMHQRSTDGKIQERDHIMRRAFWQESKEQQDRFFHSGGAGLFSKPKEYIKIMATLLNAGKSPQTSHQLLQPSTIDLMWENQIPNQPNFARGGPPPANPLLASASPEVYPQAGNPPQGWGLSMFLTLAAGETGRGANTGWWAGLANMFWWVDREKGVAGVIASQVVPFGDGVVVPAWFGVEGGVYAGLKG
ncbi:beta-lactamase/transpeptidase-like protein [Amniculicola lignicola CBS 123094]|uniref:Beta-lactamase/transpeptidase-like protein n=1 Tax=Amniculicola lignicola CBS 123094 TaxID=1392246 RepID=A0A6A5X337_9PLEO|nr:beta-lactamase/transpeptidase-like protein [Amniculicola lignicola CBS 123094]